MASSRKYAYYLRGNQIALIEEGLGTGICSLSGYSNQTTCEAAGGTWTENAISSSDGEYRSPVATVADGLEIEYAYSPRYFIDETEDKNTAIDTYVSLDGLLKIIDQGDDDYSASPESLSDGSYIVLRKAGRFNGLHKVKAAGVGYVTLYTKFSGSASVQASFEEAPELYYNVDALTDESDTIDLPEYLCKALVYYVRAQLAEDRGDVEIMLYYKQQFRALMQRYEGSRIWGSRRVVPGVGAIR